MVATSVRLVCAAHDWSHSLYELRVSSATLATLGARCFDPLTLGDSIPCFASVEADIADGVAVVPAWMMWHLDATTSTTLLRAGTSIGTVTRLVLAPIAASDVDLSGQRTHDPVVDDDDFGDLLFSDVEDALAPPPLQEPFDTAATGAIRRQLLGHPLMARAGTLCAVQRSHGTCVLRVVQVEQEGQILVGGEEALARDEGSATSSQNPACCYLGHETEILFDSSLSLSAALPQYMRDSAAGLTAPTAEQPTGHADRQPSDPLGWDGTSTAASLRPFESHGAALLSALVAHASSLLLAGSARAVPSALAEAASTGGHTLLCGPPANGKSYVLSALATRLQLDAGVRTLRLRCARLLAHAHSPGALDSCLNFVFESARRSRPCLVLLADLKLLGSASPASLGHSPDAASGGVELQVAQALLSRMRAAPAGVLLVGTGVDPLHVPSCLRAHGGFEVIYELPLPTSEQRHALIASWLPQPSTPPHDSATSDLARQRVGTLACTPPQHLHTGRRTL